MDNEQRSLIQGAAFWLIATSLLANIATFAFLWWLVITAIRSPQPAFVLPPVGESTITYPAWGKDGYHIVTKPVKP